MMKKPFPKQGLPLLALAIALTGCPALDTLSGPGPEPTPTPTPTPSATPSGDPTDDPDPNFAIKALGPVRVTLDSPIDVEHGPITVRLYHYGSSNLYEFGTLGTFSTTAPASGYANRFNPKAGSDGDYVPDDNGTHYFQSVGSMSLVRDGALTLAIGEATPSVIRYETSHLELDFPASAQGDLIATPADSSIHFQKSRWVGNEYLYSFRETGVLSLNGVNGTRSATMSVTVAITELDGSPSKNLSAANFQLSGDGRIALQATETAPGRYRLVVGLDNLDGPARRPQQRTLTVSHTPLTYTHTEETN